MLMETVFLVVKDVMDVMELLINVFLANLDTSYQELNVLPHALQIPLEMEQMDVKNVVQPAKLAQLQTFVLHVLKLEVNLLTEFVIHVFIHAQLAMIMKSVLHVYQVSIFTMKDVLAHVPKDLQQLMEFVNVLQVFSKTEYVLLIVLQDIPTSTVLVKLALKIVDNALELLILVHLVRVDLFLMLLQENVKSIPIVNLDNISLLN